MKNLTTKLLTLLICCFAINFASTQVVINEFSAANEDQFYDNYFDDEDWFELYNAGATTVDLTGYFLSDKLDNPTKFEIPAGVNIPAGGHLLVWASNRGEFAGGELHTNFKITQTRNSEAIVFSSPSGTIIDFNPIDVPNKVNESWARTTDGGSTWGVDDSPTPDASNTSVKEAYAERPQITPPAGAYTGSVLVNIEIDDPTLTIRYTTNGNDPTQFSTEYTGPFTLNNTTVIKAIAISNDPNVPVSHIDFNTYLIDENHTVPVVSITGAQLTTLLGGSYIEPRGTFEYFETNGERVADVSGEFNKHGNDSWAYPQRGIDFIARDEYGEDYTVKHAIFDPEITDRDKFQRVILKAAANDNYPSEDGAHVRDAYVHTLSQRAELVMDERTSAFVVMYVNGEYWGVYDIREKVDDHDYTKYYYDQGRNDIDFLKTWGPTWAEYGQTTDWNSLVNYILSNDMTVDANYQYVEGEFEVLSLIDYVILHSHNVSSDWLNWNTAWWRGNDPDGGAQKWRYALWDEDATFGHYINYTGVPDVSANADPCNPELLGDPGGEGHIPVFNALLENQDFLSLYISRYADLNNTYLNCDYMVALLDEMTGTIAPEMARHTDRWGGSVSGWESNVQELRDFILLRCTIISEGIVDCYEDEGISGPYDITIDVQPNGAGTVRANTLEGLNYPWIAEYFGGINFDLLAIPECGYEFVNWEVANHTFGPDQFSDAISMSLITDDTIVANFEALLELELDPVDPLCLTDGPVSLTANLPGGTWDGAPGGIFTPTDNGGGTHTVTYSIEDVSLGCIVATTVDVIVYESLEVTITPENAGACVDLDSIPMAAITTGGEGNYTFSWITPTGPSNDSLFVANTDGEYIVNIFDGNNCVATDTFMLNILDGTSVAPVAEAGMTSELNCYENEVTLNGTDSESGSGIVYEWSGPGITGSSTTNMTTANQPGIYTLVVTNNSNGCSSTDQVNITQDIAEPTVVTNMPEMLDCNTSEVTLDGTGSSFGSQFTYEWTDILGNPVGSTLSTTVSNIGLYNLTVLNTDNGCDEDANVGVLENTDVPTLASFTVTEPECFGNTDASITVGEITGGVEPFVYSIDGEPYSTDQFFSNLTTGDHTISIQDVNGCELEEVVNIFQPLQITFDLGIDQFKKLGDSIIISSETNVPYDRIDTIIWSLPLPFDCDDPECLEIGFSTFTTIGVNATLIDINGCSETDEIIINLDQQKDVYVPTAFTPNGDGDNDYFTIYVNEAQVAQLRNFRIYNRWGGVMFQSLNLPINQETAGWDGSFNGKYVSPGVYIYDVEVDLIDGRTERVSGDVTVHN